MHTARRLHFIPTLPSPRSREWSGRIPPVSTSRYSTPACFLTGRNHIMCQPVGSFLPLLRQLIVRQEQPVRSRRSSIDPRLGLGSVPKRLLPAPRRVSTCRDENLQDFVRCPMWSRKAVCRNRTAAACKRATEGNAGCLRRGRLLDAAREGAPVVLLLV
jgi:hypothetical protein